jgi:Na+-driven multidrug efflux pump
MHIEKTTTLFYDSAGIIRGSGQQKIAAYVNLGAYYVMGIPTAIVLAFVFHIGGKVLVTKSLYSHNLIFPAYFFLHPSGINWNVILAKSSYLKS